MTRDLVGVFCERITKLNIYLSARFGRQEEMKAIREEILDSGHLRQTAFPQLSTPCLQHPVEAKGSVRNAPARVRRHVSLRTDGLQTEPHRPHGRPGHFRLRCLGARSRRSILDQRLDARRWRGDEPYARKRWHNRPEIAFNCQPQHNETHTCFIMSGALTPP